MLFNYKSLLFSLLLLLPINVVEAAKSTLSSDGTLERVEKTQEKPTFRKKIYIWGGIATGVLAGVATAAGLYFRSQKPLPIKFKGDGYKTFFYENPEATPEAINTKEAIKEINKMKSEEELRNLYYKPGFTRNDKVKEAYDVQKKKLQDEEVARIKSEIPKLQDTIIKATTVDQIDDIEDKVIKTADQNLIVLMMLKRASLASKK